MAQPIPAHLIAGFLGAGKTTTLLGLLRALGGRGEKAAVLVNEFGQLGIDGTVLSGSEDALAVKEIPGGCICCTLAGRLMEALREIAERVRPTRLFIEPTGLARPSEVRRILALPELAGRYTLAPVLTIVEPATFLKLLGRNMPFYDGQVREAEILIANKMDRLSGAEVPRFREELKKANAKARIVETTYGKLPEDLIEAMLSTAASAAPSGREAGHDHHAPGHSIGFQKPLEVTFDAARLRAFFEGLASGAHGARPWRAKGLFKCAAGWRLWNLSESGVDELEVIVAPPGSRCDIVTEKKDPAQQQAWLAELEACVTR